ncbi:hypothetical protein Esti_000139 [Eimeria stiedai]
MTDAHVAKGEQVDGGRAEGQRARRVQSCRQKARSLQRLLEHRKDLPREVQAEMRSTAEALQKQHRQRIKELKRHRFIRAKKALYSKLKFYELKKVQRRLQRTRKQLVELLSKQQQQAAAAVAGISFKRKQAGEEASRERADETLTTRIAELQQQLRLQLDDLNYVRLYPADEPYIALFPAQDSEESQQKRNAMRLRIRELRVLMVVFVMRRAQMLKSRMADEGNDSEDAGGDDMFVEASQEEREAAASADPFEDAATLSDEEAAVARYKNHQQRSHHFKNQNKMVFMNHNHGGTKVLRGEGKTYTQTREFSSTNRHTRTNGNCQHTAYGAQRQEKHGKAFKEKGRKEPMKEVRKDGDARHLSQGRADTSSARQKKQQPARIGLSKHKPANQHLIFNSDEE